MDSIIRKIDALTEELRELQPVKAEAQQKLDKKFRLEFNYNSNHIEGNTLTYGETELLLIFDDTKGNHSLREYEEMKSHDVAFQMIRELAASKEHPLTEAFIKNLNEIILVRPFWKDATTSDGQQTRRLINVGNYKEHPNSVRLSNGEMFEYASPLDTPILMQELIDWYKTESEKNELHPIALASLLHYKFVCIHPFDDGNGRISRLLMNYVLFRNNLPPVVIKSADKRNYLSALNLADTGDINGFIQYIAEQLVWSRELSVKAAKGESIDEPEDLDKEIAVWKKAVKTHTDITTHRNDFLVERLYHNGFEKLFLQIEDKLRAFYDMFYRTKITTYKNNSGQEGLAWLSEKMKEISHISEPIVEFINDEPVILSAPDTFSSIMLAIKLEEYKQINNAFNVTSRIEVELQPYKYLIKHNSKRLVENDYTTTLNDQQIRDLVKTCISVVFDEIKEKSRSK